METSQFITYCMYVSSTFITYTNIHIKSIILAWLDQAGIGCWRCLGLVTGLIPTDGKGRSMDSCSAPNLGNRTAKSGWFLKLVKFKLKRGSFHMKRERHDSQKSFLWRTMVSLDHWLYSTLSGQFHSVLCAHKKLCTPSVSLLFRSTRIAHTAVRAFLNSFSFRQNI